MSLIKKVDVKKHLAARPLSQPDATGFPEIEPAGTGANGSDFIEDFSPEHSFSRMSVTAIAIGAESGSTRVPSVAGSAQV